MVEGIYSLGLAYVFHWQLSVEREDARHSLSSISNPRVILSFIRVHNVCHHSMTLTEYCYVAHTCTLHSTVAQSKIASSDAMSDSNS